MRARLFRLIVAGFPASTRAQRGDEMLEALDELELRATQVIRESLSLLWAGSVAWSRYLRSCEGLWRSAYAGAVIWFVSLLAIGPLLRLRFTLRAGSSVPGSQAGPLPYMVAVGFCLLAGLVMRRSRWAAAALGGVGIGTAAASNVIGTWGFAASAAYEARWLGFALLLVAVIGARAGGDRSLPVWFPLAGVALVTGAVIALPLDAYQSHASRNYGMMLQWELWPWFQGTAGQGLWEWVVVAGVSVVLIAVFLHPWPSAFAAAPIVHLVVVNVRVGLGLLLLVGVAVSWRLLLDRVEVRIRWRRQ